MGGVSAEEGQRGFAPFRDVALALGVEKEEQAAGFSHCCSSGPAGPVLPTEFPFQSVSVKGSEQSRAVAKNWKTQAPFQRQAEAGRKMWLMNSKQLTAD